MRYWKKCLLVLCFIGTMYFGGICIQNETPLVQGLGLIIVIFSFILLYAISTVMWFSLSFVQSFFLIGSITLYILYCFGIIGHNIPVDITQQPDAHYEVVTDAAEEVADIKEIGFSQTEVDNLATEMFGNETLDKGEDKNVTETTNLDTVEPTNNINEQNVVSSISLLDKVKNFISNNEQEEETKIFNPMDYDYIEGEANVVTGSILKMRGIYVHLLGIDAPDRNQTCADKRGISYSCGMRAVTWLQDWLEGKQVRCHLVGEVVKGHVTGTCFTDNQKYDIAAVMANSGWALAYTKNVSIYVPYEKQAKDNRRGLWQGRFYKPWDWRKLQNRKIEVIIKDKSEGFGGVTNWFKGLF